MILLNVMVLIDTIAAMSELCDGMLINITVKNQI